MKVIKRKNLPANLPVIHTLFSLLALDYWNAPQWLYGAVAVVLFIAWVASIYSIIKEEQTDIFNQKN